MLRSPSLFLALLVSLLFSSFASAQVESYLPDRTMDAVDVDTLPVTTLEMFDPLYSPVQSAIDNDLDASTTICLTDTGTSSIWLDCWMSWDSCKSAYALNLGDAAEGSLGDYGWLTSPDAYFAPSGGECSGREWSGSMNRTTGKLYAYVGNASGLVSNENRFGTYLSYVDLYVTEYYDYDCNGTTTGRYFYDQQDCVWGPYTTGTCNTGFVAQAQKGIGDCATNELVHETQATCHMPDVMIAGPGVVGVRSYGYTIAVQFLDYYGAYASPWVEAHGCFGIVWT